MYLILSRQGVYFSSEGWCDYIKSKWRLREPHDKDSTAITLFIAINYAPALNIIYKNSRSNMILSQNLFLQLQLFILLNIILLIHIMTSVMYGGPEMYVIFYASEITLWYVDNSSIINFRRSQWSCGLRRRSSAARLLRSWVRIPPKAWMFVLWVLCVVR